MNGLLRMRFIAVYALLATLCAGTALASNTPTAGVFEGCAARGVGGDPDLNLLKNRAAQVAQPKVMTVAQINALPVPDGAIRNGRQVKRAGWPQAATAQVSPLEQTGVVVTGYLKNAVEEGPEATNCRSTSRDLHDYHLWLVDSRTLDRDKSIVVEITPRWRAANHGWVRPTLKHFADQGVQVRITGWLMLDQDHPEQIGKTRGGLWEIHPITKIERLSGGQWIELVD